MLKRLSFLFLFSASLYGNAWFQNIDQALQQSRKDHKSLFIVFLGPESCPWSEKFQTDVLDRAEFQESLKKDFLFVKSKFSDEKWREAYQIEDFPSVLLMRSDKEGMAEIPYQLLETKEYIQLVQGIYNFAAPLTAAALEKKSETELEALYLQARQMELKDVEARVLHAGLKLDKGAFFLIQKFSRLLKSKRFKDVEVQELRKKILERDPDNETRAHLKVALLDFEALNRKFKKKNNSHRVVKPLLDYVDEWGDDDKENLWMVEATIAQYLYNKNNRPSARRHAKLAYNAAPKEMKSKVESMDCFSKK